MSEVGAAAVWLGAMGSLAAAGWRAAAALFPDESPFPRLLHTVVVWWGALVVAGMAVGIPGALTPVPLVAAALATSGAVCWAVRRAGPAARGGGPPPSADGASDWWFRCGWVLLAAVGLTWVIANGLLKYPSDWDSLNYHLPIVHAWLRHHSLYAPDSQEWFVPGTNEIVGLWLTGLFSGDFLVGLTNVPAVVVLSLAAIQLARVVGLPTVYSHLAGLTAVFSGVAFHQAITAKNDIAATALFVAGLGYALRHARGGRPADLTLAAVSLGLLAGVKYYAPGYAAVVGFTWVACRLATGGRRGAVRVIAAGLVGGLVFGGYWYVRNAVLTGTPLYPKGLSAGTDELARVRPEGTWGTTLFGHRSPDVFPLALEAVWTHAGPLYYATVLAMPAALLWLAFSTRCLPVSAEREEARVPRVGLAAAVFGCFLVWGVLPFTVEIEPGTMYFIRNGYLPTRFGLPFLTALAVAAAVPLGDLMAVARWRWARLAAAAAGAAAVAAQAAHVLRRQVSMDDALEAAVPAAGLVAALVLLREAWGLCPVRLRRAAGVVSVAAAAAAFAAACSVLSARWHAGFDRHFEAAYESRVFTRLGEPDLAARKFFLAGYKPYPFAGSGRQRAVARSLRLADFPQFEAYLRHHDVSHVVVARFDPNWGGQVSNIRRWVDDRTDVFVLVFVDDNYAVYRFDPTRPAADR